MFHDSVRMANQKTSLSDINYTIEATRAEIAHREVSRFDQNQMNLNKADYRVRIIGFWHFSGNAVLMSLILQFLKVLLLNLMEEL